MKNGEESETASLDIRGFELVDGDKSLDFISPAVAIGWVRSIFVKRDKSWWHYVICIVFFFLIIISLIFIMLQQEERSAKLKIKMISSVFGIAFDFCKLTFYFVAHNKIENKKFA